jgi:hypothetical protein
VNAFGLLLLLLKSLLHGSPLHIVLSRMHQCGTQEQYNLVQYAEVNVKQETQPGTHSDLLVCWLQALMPATWTRWAA